MGREVVYIDVDREKRNTAGAKAPEDISELCRRMGMVRFYMPAFPIGGNFFYQRIWLIVVCTFYWLKLERTLQSGSIVVYQHPIYGARIAERFIPRIQKKKGCKFIALIHDLESLRKGIEGVKKNNEKTNKISDSILLKYCDVIICHNRKMKQYLIQQGFNPDRLVELGIFDYLCDCNRVQLPKGKQPSVAIAGNLAYGKCSYVYEMFGNSGNINKNLEVHLYGNNFDEEAGDQKRLIYHGSFQPEELPQKLEGDFGLVWDGNSAETCAGNTGEYLKYNDPHKTSLYLAAGMPVVTWRQAAIADFVLENNVGIVVDSLYDLEIEIVKISDDDYRVMCENAAGIGKKIRSGWFFKESLRKCFHLPIFDNE